MRQQLDRIFDSNPPSRLERWHRRLVVALLLCLAIFMSACNHDDDRPVTTADSSSDDAEDEPTSPPSAAYLASGSEAWDRAVRSMDVCSAIDADFDPDGVVYVLAERLPCGGEPESALCDQIFNNGVLRSDIGEVDANVAKACGRAPAAQVDLLVGFSQRQFPGDELDELLGFFDPAVGCGIALEPDDVDYQISPLSLGDEVRLCLEGFADDGAGTWSILGPDGHAAASGETDVFPGLTALTFAITPRLRHREYSLQVDAGGVQLKLPFVVVEPERDRLLVHDDGEPGKDILAFWLVGYEPNTVQWIHFYADIFDAELNEQQCRLVGSRPIEVRGDGVGLLRMSPSSSDPKVPYYVFADTNSNVCAFIDFNLYEPPA